jgi:hypothetical protein
MITLMDSPASATSWKPKPVSAKLNRYQNIAQALRLGGRLKQLVMQLFTLIRGNSDKILAYVKHA